MENFRKLGLSKEILDVIRDLGFEDPTEIQEKTIPLALTGKDIIGGSATGSGKTLAFISPIIENLRPNMHTQALILTPTRELAKQITKVIKKFSKNKELNTLAIYGGVNIRPQIKKLSTTDVVVGTPGRILDHINRKTLDLHKIKFLVLDEVDRMFDMGFTKDVEKIIRECPGPDKRQTMMFSATISPSIDYLAKKHTKKPKEVSVKSYVDHSKLKQVYYDVPDHKKFSLLVSLLKKEDSDLVMVFCNTRRNVDFVTRNLKNNGISAKAIHGGLKQNKRRKVMDKFHKKGVGVLVCTNVAARGLHIDDVSHIYNYDTPKDPKDYIHRIGRTARAGKKGKAITILDSRNYENFRKLLYSENVKIESKDLPGLEKVQIKIRSKKRSYKGRKRRYNRGKRRESKKRNQKNNRNKSKKRHHTHSSKRKKRNKRKSN